ncbi:MAG TPA: mercuric reductase [Blastocatellia bacterium]|jgi:pyruvate/2-oxoglutarate dehydrogenase complex dihydrolipoamide dehydrogenase (E3) component|nr:mercuric reductase [Blastocatellia bacterium]
MVNPTNYDAIVIGTGQAGNPLSKALANAGWKTAVIERLYVGGTCVNVGCTPTKTMVASARVAYLARRAADYGVHAGEVLVNMVEVRQRKQSIVDSFRSGGQRAIENTKNLDLLFGEASFTGPRSIAVKMNDGELRRLTANKIFINTGGRPAAPRVDGIDQIAVLDSTSIMELDELPEHLLVLGGGYVGLEFGQMFRRFGSRVTIVQRASQLLGREDQDVADEVAKILGEDGVEVLLNTEAKRVEKGGDGEIRLTVQTPEGAQKLTGSHLLAAAGRVPNTETLSLSSAGIETDKNGFIKANDRLETSAPGVYALGDVKGGPQFTHISYDDYRIIRTNLIEGGNATVNDRLVPYTVFIDPQLGRVGLSESEARASGANIRVAKMPMSYVARALEVGESRGFMKAVVDADTKQILGCAVLGIEGGEVMAMIQIAMMGRLPYNVLKDGIFAHPTLAESLNNLFGYLQ